MISLLVIVLAIIVRADHDVVIQFHREDSIQLSTSLPRHEKMHQFRQSLHQQVTKRQEKVRHLLTSHNITNPRVLWLHNQLAVENISVVLLQELKTHPDVVSILPDTTQPHISSSFLPSLSRQLRSKDSSAVPWGIERVEAPKVWAATQGKGTIVGVIDTGIYPSHGALGTNRVIAWLDAVYGKKEPYDNDSHGTHVAGTIGGRYGIGIAPQVEFIVCKAFDSKLAKNSALAECGKSRDVMILLI